MAGEGLAGHLLGKAEARREEIAARAREEAGRLKAAALAEAEALEAAEGAAVAREAQRVRAVRLGRARVEARAIAAQARAALAGKILSALSARLARLPGEAGFPEVAERLCRELLPELPPEGGVVRGDPASLEAFRRIVPNAGCRFEPLAPEELGGVEASDEAGTFRIRNTLASRFQKGRPALLEEIGRALEEPDE